MTKSKILISAYTCNPYGVSESYAAFNFINILLKHFSIVLFTTKENELEINRFFDNNNVIKNKLRIISFYDSYPLKSKAIVRDSLKIGYYVFNYKLFRFLKNNPDLIREVDLLYHKSPSSFRCFSSLSKFDKPFIFGPTGGGLQNPKILSDYFKNDNNILKLKKLDNFLLKTRFFKKHFNKAENILITLPYVKEIIGSEYNSKYFEIFDSGIDTKSNINNYKNYDSNTICFVGRLTPYKGASLLIKSIKIIHKEFPDLQVEIVGDGEEKDKLIELSNKLNLNSIINFHGHLCLDDVKKIYKKSSVFCFPTITEASGNSLLEAMSYGLPIVTINNGGPKYMCPDDGAFKIDIDDLDVMIKNIANRLTFLLSNKNVCLEMGKINREHCVKNYDWRVIEQNLLNFFKNKIKSLSD